MGGQQSSPVNLSVALPNCPYTHTCERKKAARVQAAAPATVKQRQAAAASTILAGQHCRCYSLCACVCVCGLIEIVYVRMRVPSRSSGRVPYSRGARLSFAFFTYRSINVYVLMDWI
jgi:hypothetical protein